MSIVRRAAALLVLCTLLVACRVDATVDVEVADDGSGVVRVAVVLDADAAARAPELAGTLPTDDLAAVGWTVAPADTAADGSVTLRADKPFAAPEQLPVVLSEVSTAFQRFELERSRSFGKVTWSVTGLVDLTGGAEALGDDQLAALLGGRSLGRDVAALEQEIGSSLADATSLGLRITLPGGASEAWSFRLDQTAPEPVEIDGTVTRSSVMLWAIGAIAAAGLVALLVLVRLLGRRRRREPRRARRGSQRPSGATVFDGSAPGAPSTRPPERRLELVITAAHGVLWEPHTIAERWLVGLLETQGVHASVDDVRAIMREGMLGRISSAEVWRALGAGGDPAELDAAFVARFTLSPHIVELVTTMGRRGVGVACVTDDVAEWSALLRQRFELDRFVRPWVVSAEVGAISPAPGLLEEALRRAGVPARNCLMLDADLAHLQTAKKLGMSTVLIGPSSAGAAERGHRHATDLGDLLARRSGSVRT